MKLNDLVKVQDALDKLADITGITFEFKYVDNKGFSIGGNLTQERVDHLLDDQSIEEIKISIKL